MTDEEEGRSVAGLAVMTLFRRLRKQPAATTVTVTRVTGRQDDDEPSQPETVVVTTAPAQPVDTAAHQMARTAMVVASVAAALAVVSIAYRVIRNELRRLPP